MLEKLQRIKNYLENLIEIKPKYGIVLGTGLNNLVDSLEIIKSISYENIPEFPKSTVEGHEGNLLFAKINNIDVMIMQGRFHFYEGYSMDEVTLPIRLMKILNIQKVILSNAAGGMNSNFEIGDVMIINDHINLAPSPLIGKNISELGTRFPDMSEPYSKEMIESAERIFNKSKIYFHKGTYVCVTGPNLETPAEYKFLKIIGGDAVGMSTVPEVIVARHMNMQCFAVSVITDLGVEGKIEKVTHEEIQQAAKKAQPNLITLIKKIIN
ncbi:MAG: purine-nucleoside phosphorylase [Flavobacteriales bacterium TMED84]|nr:MAG: purine-nucleoside phosphorylase [Flavobacteriales bacterium TMED84]|tara:strand:+ start:4616 stop:5419 length:804 start_codon:yes stop_codon:yes gene_type:complete